MIPYRFMLVVFLLGALAYVGVSRATVQMPVSVDSKLFAVDSA